MRCSRLPKAEAFTTGGTDVISTAMRVRAEFICSRIAQGAPVELSDMAWLQKLAERNPSVASWLRRARRSAVNSAMPEGGMDRFLSDLDLGDPDPSNHLRGGEDVGTLAEWFSARRAWFRGQG